MGKARPSAEKKRRLHEDQQAGKGARPSADQPFVPASGNLHATEQISCAGEYSCAGRPSLEAPVVSCTGASACERVTVVASELQIAVNKAAIPAEAIYSSAGMTVLKQESGKPLKIQCQGCGNCGELKYQCTGSEEVHTTTIQPTIWGWKWAGENWATMVPPYDLCSADGKNAAKGGWLSADQQKQTCEDPSMPQGLVVNRRRLLAAEMPRCNKSDNNVEFYCISTDGFLATLGVKRWARETGENLRNGALMYTICIDGREREIFERQGVALVSDHTGPGC